MAMTITFIVFWAMKPCSLLEIYQLSEDGHAWLVTSKKHDGGA